MSGFDFLGDVHGHVGELAVLLRVLGYEERTVGGSRAFRHPSRTAVFVGDLIDRGPEVRETLQLVRSMVEAGSALCALGNHELNALGFHTEDPDRPGEFLRWHTEAHREQHRATLEQVPAGELASHLEWFRTLPFTLELGTDSARRRVVHACWDAPSLAVVGEALARHGGLSEGFLVEAHDHASPLYDAVEILLKGKEMQLPAGHEFVDKDGSVRDRARVRWYLEPDGHDARSYVLQRRAAWPVPGAEDGPGDDEAGEDGEEPLADPLAPLAGVPIPERVRAEARPYAGSEPPVFVGHYWLEDPEPELLAPNVACLDFSVARGGFLCAYRSDGEPRLERERFVWLPR